MSWYLLEVYGLETVKTQLWSVLNELAELLADPVNSSYKAYYDPASIVFALREYYSDDAVVYTLMFHNGRLVKFHTTRRIIERVEIQ